MADASVQTREVAPQPRTAEILLQGGENTTTSWPFSADPLTRGRGSWAALLCGLVSVVGGVLFGWTLPFAIVAITLGLVGVIRGSGHIGNNIGAIVCGMIGTGLSLGWIIYSIVVISSQT